MMKPSVFCLMGPTASGKTQLALELSHHFPVDIISVDSAMVYRDMDIGTAKPSPDILKKIPHRLINLCDPTEIYSAAQFRQDALCEIEAILSQKKIPLLVGGTMLYFRALQQGLAEMPSANAKIRKKIEAESLSIGWPALHAQLEKIDPISAKRIHPQDGQRIQRALEIYQLTGKNVTYFQQRQPPFSLPYTMMNMAIAPMNRNKLHQRIEKRFDAMLEQGLIEEVKKLYDRGDLSLDFPSMRSVGYRQVWDYLSGKITYDVMREKSIIASRQLAKRQLTWLCHWPDVTWFDSEAIDLVDQVVRFMKSVSFFSF